MSLKFRLAFLYSMSVFIILLISAFSIFLFNENFRKDEFTKRLTSEATEAIQVYFSVPGAPKHIVDNLNQHASNSTHRERIFIYDSSYHLIFSTLETPAPPVSPEAFKTALNKQEYFFEDNLTEGALLRSRQNGKLYYVLATGYDVYGRRKSDNLKVLLTASVFGGLFLSGFLAFFYVRQVMRPLEKLKGQIEKIDEKNLRERIAVGAGNSEIWQIAKKFNEMLDRLEQAFEQRKNFVQHASHELRTPLANMLSQTESALGRDMSVEDYHKVLVSLKEDQQDMIELTNSLLTLSRYEKISFVSDSSTIRIDEVLYETVDFAEETWPGAMVSIDFVTVPENQSELEFRGNEFLIKSAVRNLVKNAIHYSLDKRVKISILVEKRGIVLHFENNGRQLTPDEQNRLFIPFFRGENAINKKGYGLGLSIVQRIVNVHNGTISYHSLSNGINRFTIYLPSNKQ